MQPIEHSIGGVTLASNCRFDELPIARAGRPALMLEWDSVAMPAEPSVWFRRDTLTDGSCWMRIGRTDDGYFLRFDGRADFWVQADGSRVVCRTQPGSPTFTVRHLFLDQVLPMILSRRGLNVLHSSAVRLRSGTVAFAGASGSGKSTLAAALSRLGYPTVADDCAVVTRTVGGYELAPYYPGLRLWADSLREVWNGRSSLPTVSDYSDKRRLTDLPFADTGGELRRLYFVSIGTGDEMTVSPLSGSRAALRLFQSRFLLDTEDAVELSASFAFAEQLARSTLCVDLRLPPGLHLLDACARRIAGELGEVLA